MLLKPIEKLFEEIDKNGKVSYQNWFKDIANHYNKFLPLVYTNTSVQELIKGSRRIKTLFKYWAINKVRTLEEAKASIPLCKYCQKELALPRSTEPKNEDNDWIVSCSCVSCCKKYNQDKTQESMLKIHGVNNANGLESVRLFKSKKQKENYFLRGDEIIEKRRNTVREKHGVDNVSQLDSIKEAKQKTLRSHYGVDNPNYSSEINIKRVSSFLNAKTQKFVLCRKLFPILHISEANFLTFLSNYINVKNMESNKTIFEKVIDGKSRCTCIDITIDDTLFIELKSECDFVFNDKNKDNEDYFQHHANIVLSNLKPNQRYILYVRLADNEGHMLILKPNGQYTLMTTSVNNFSRFRRCFTQNMINHAEKIYSGANTDDVLIRLAYRLSGKNLSE